MLSWMTFNQIKKKHMYSALYLSAILPFFTEKKRISFFFLYHFFFKKKTMSKLGTDENPIDTSYYELLDVSPTADAMQIKKAYRLVILSR